MFRKLLFLAVVVFYPGIPAWPAPRTVTIRSLKVLVVIYRGGAEDRPRLRDADVEHMKNGIELARLFSVRNTRCRLNLDVTYRVLAATAPDNEGPTCEHIEADLRARGVRDDEYDGIYCGGVGLVGNWGGFRVFGHTGAAFSGAGPGGRLESFPAVDPEVWYDAGWCFTHEFHHALDGPLCGGDGHPEMLSAHPYSDAGEPHFRYGHHAAQHWDWIAHSLAMFPDYLAIRGATDSTITFRDADGDGMPDCDPRLPMDEDRFGSHPGTKDTDGDGRDDLDEFCADIYRGSNPCAKDTDGDGRDDREDPAPTVALAPAIAYAAVDPVVDGTLDDAYLPLAGRAWLDDAPELGWSGISACWNEDALYLFVRSRLPAALELLVDSSAENGFWEGGDTYPIRARPDGAVEFRDLLSGPVPGATAKAGPEGLEVRIPAEIGQGVSLEVNFGGRRRPEDVTDGLRLEADRTISLNLALRDGEHKVLFTPLWSMFDVRLAKSESDPPRPSLRHTTRVTTDERPVVVVSGVRPEDEVTIFDEDGREIGRRTGSGEVRLAKRLRAGPDARTGGHVLTARAGGRDSRPVTVVVDDGALPPVVAWSEDGRHLRIEGEPGARVEVVAVDSGRYTPLFDLVLDAAGRAERDVAALDRSFRGEYGRGTDFDRPLLSRLDPHVDFAFGGGAPDPRLPADGFCARWTGWIDVPANGTYTFRLVSDDGSRLFLDGRPLVDNWGLHPAEEVAAEVRLPAGEHGIRVDYFEAGGDASVRLEWSGPGIEWTRDLPVHPLPKHLRSGPLAARQRDPVGHVSRFGPPARR